MKRIFVFLAAVSCIMALSATNYMCHIKVNVNGSASEQDQVLVEVNENNGTYDLSMKNFCLEAEGMSLPVGTIAATGVNGVDEFGYTTVKINEPIAIAAGDDPQYEGQWIGPMLGEVPVDLTARFIDTALSANIDIALGDMIIEVSVFGVAPATETLKGDVNGDGNVNISDVNSVIGIILGN